MEAIDPLGSSQSWVREQGRAQERVRVIGHIRRSRAVARGLNRTITSSTFLESCSVDGSWNIGVKVRGWVSNDVGNGVGYNSIDVQRNNILTSSRGNIGDRRAREVGKVVRIEDLGCGRGYSKCCEAGDESD